MEQKLPKRAFPAAFGRESELSLHSLAQKLNLKEKEAIMRWKLGLGDFNKLIEGKSPLPDKSRKAERQDFMQPMPDKDVSEIGMRLTIEEPDMQTLRQGHIPEVQEDHWYLYCDESHIRYYRSWTGMCAFEAHYYKSDGEMYIVDRLKVNHALAEFGVNNDMSAQYLFLYLLVAEVEAGDYGAWLQFIDVWEKSNGLTKKEE